MELLTSTISRNEAIAPGNGSGRGARPRGVETMSRNMSTSLNPKVTGYSLGWINGWMGAVSVCEGNWPIILGYGSQISIIKLYTQRMTKQPTTWQPQHSRNFRLGSQSSEVDVSRESTVSHLCWCTVHKFGFWVLGHHLAFFSWHHPSPTEKSPPCLPKRSVVSASSPHSAA